MKTTMIDEAVYDVWIRNHKGPLIDVVARIWYCDDECDCSEPEIIERYQNLKERNWVVSISIWTGTYRINENGAEGELTAKRTNLRITNPELEACIIWPEWTTLEKDIK